MEAIISAGPYASCLWMHAHGPPVGVSKDARAAATERGLIEGTLAWGMVMAFEGLAAGKLALKAPGMLAIIIERRCVSRGTSLYGTFRCTVATVEWPIRYKKWLGFGVFGFRVSTCHRQSVVLGASKMWDETD